MKCNLQLVPANRNALEWNIDRSQYISCKILHHFLQFNRLKIVSSHLLAEFYSRMLYHFSFLPLPIIFNPMGFSILAFSAFCRHHLIVMLHLLRCRRALVQFWWITNQLMGSRLSHNSMGNPWQSERGFSPRGCRDQQPIPSRLASKLEQM